jgi:adenosylmethionine-8-amino-7-oxononanoate aminotransferase
MPATDSSGAARDLTARDAAAVWHPFTQHAQWLDDQPLVVDRAEGMYLFDVDGRRYLDWISSLWVTVHCHSVPEINDAIAAQLARLDHSTFLGFTHEPGIELAEKLLEVAPKAPPASSRAPLSKVFYAGDGASAVEAAIKMAYQAKSQRGETRPYYVHFAEGYHGDTLGAVSVGGIELFHHTYRPILLDTFMVSSPGVISDNESREQRAAVVLSELRGLMESQGDAVCAIVIEPMVQAAGGMLTHDASFVAGVRALADEFGAFLVADEVATGIGRTGQMWAVEHAGVVPDLLTCGKGITGGYLPLSAVLATNEVYESFLGTPASGRTFFHGHSYTANPLCAAAAIANLDLMKANKTVARAHEIGERIGRLTKSLADRDSVTEIRRIGTMTGIEVRPRGERTGFRVCQHARELGVILRPLGDVVVLMPPLGISDEQLDELVDVAEQSINAVVG